MATFARTQLNGVPVLQLGGSLTQHGIDQVEADFDAAVTPGAKVVVDLARVDLITTPGITLLVSTAKRVRKTGGRVVFAGAPVAVREMFHRCRLDEVLELADDRAQAAKTCLAES